MTGLRSEHVSSDEDSSSTTDESEIKTFSFAVSEPTNGHALKDEMYVLAAVTSVLVAHKIRLVWVIGPDISP